MREAAFVKTNLSRWQEFEKLVEDPSKTNPDRLSDLFVQVTDDLAYAKSHYPDSKTLTYLNGLASKVHAGIYKNRKEDKSRIKTFALYELPEVMYRGRKYLLVAFLYFVFAAMVGAFSLENDEGFARLILGDSYVNMTLNNIERGDPMAVYKDSPSFGMFIMIAINNIKVSMIAFAAGIFFALGTLLVLFRNGMMVGVFQYFFVKQGLGLYSFLSIWIHGTLEISAIVIAGGAGLMMGQRMLFPGTYSRGLAMRQGARDGIKVIIGLMPVFLLAAFFESYFTRMTEWPDALQASIIFLSAVFVIGYYVWYPHYLYHRPAGAEEEVSLDALPAT